MFIIEYLHESNENNINGKMLLVGCRNNTVVFIMPTQNIELTKLKLNNNVTTITIKLLSYYITCNATKFVNISGTILTMCH